MFAFDKNTPSPSLHSLIPTIGAGLILIFSNSKNLVGKLLGNKLLVGIGLISYSTYLWHYPIIAFSKLRSLFGFAVPNSILVVSASLALAYLSWKFIESPFRNKNIVSSKSIVYFSIIGILAFVSLGSVIYFENGFRNLKNRIPPNLIWLALGEKLDVKGDVCTPSPDEKSGIIMCDFGDLSSTKNIVLYGDSHLTAISEELNKAFIELKIKGTTIVNKKIGYGTFDICDVIPELRTYSPKNTDTTDRCLTGFKNILSYIKKSNAEVIFASRWSFKLYPIKNQIDDMPYKNSEGGMENETYREYVSVINGNISFTGVDKKLTINHFIDGLLSATNRLYLIYPIPEIGWDIARTNISYYKANGTLLGGISIPYSDFVSRNRFINSVFNEYKNNPNVIPIKPGLIFCDTFLKNRCVAQYKKIPYYYDDDHLSDAGARLIVDKLKGKFK